MNKVSIGHETHPQSLNVLLVLQLPRLHYVYRANGLAPTHKSDIV